ncbi:membrane protein [Pseudomonas aeruginosa]|nr:membrane protein [Pseudomonas aeruginosa]
MIIGEATQQALLGDDFSLVNAVLVIITLIVIDVGLSLLKLRHPKLDTLIEGSPTLIVEYGRPLHARLAEARLREEDILLAARETQGLETHGADPLRHPREERQDLDHSRSRRLTLRAWRISSGWMLRPCTQMLRATRLSTRSLAGMR